MVSDFIELADGGDSADVLFNLPFLVLHCVILANSAGSQLIIPSFWMGKDTKVWSFLVLFCSDFVLSPQFTVLCVHLAEHWKGKIFEKN